MKMRRPNCIEFAFVLLWLLMASLRVTAVEPQVVFLWQSGAPGSEAKSAEEAVRVTEGGEHVVSSVHRPSVTAYLPSKSTATGAAVIIAPGGGHRELWMDHEGANVAKWLSDHNVTAFVLRYRLAREKDSTYTIQEHSLPDTQRAIRLVRNRASEWASIQNASV